MPRVLEYFVVKKAIGFTLNVILYTREGAIIWKKSFDSIPYYKNIKGNQNQNHDVANNLFPYRYRVDRYFVFECLHDDADNNDFVQQAIYGRWCKWGG